VGEADTTLETGAVLAEKSPEVGNTFADYVTRDVRRAKWFNVGRANGCREAVRLHAREKLQRV
jgi:hypothetical protein